jgi:succinate dehydrogenase hydrophobic anchor subunit
MKMMEIPVRVRYFKNRQSRIARNLFHYAWQTVKIIFKSVIYYRPLRAFGILSFFLLIIGLPIMIILGIRYLLTDTITPHKALGIISLVLVIMSFVSFVVGMILQLLSRIQMNIDKILYHERKNQNR